MRIQMELITPEIARKYLATSVGNIRLKTNKAAVQRYAREMKNGEWSATHQAIAFNEEGRLVDGHHRLLAVIFAGIGISMSVVRDVPVNAVKNMDRGFGRSLDDSLAKVQGYGGTLSAMFSRMSNYKRSEITPRKWIELGHKHEAALDFAVGAFNSGRRFPKGVKNTLIAGIVARAWYSAPVDRLTCFVEILSTGVTRDPSDEPAIRVRDLLQNPKKVHRALRYLYLENGLRHFINRTPMMHLKAAVEELFPIPDDLVQCDE